MQQTNRPYQYFVETAKDVRALVSSRTNYEEHRKRLIESLISPQGFLTSMISYGVITCVEDRLILGSSTGLCSDENFIELQRDYASVLRFLKEEKLQVSLAGKNTLERFANNLDNAALILKTA
jgi:hypothetical protein